MRPSIQSLGWFVRRSPQPDALVDFYAGTVGLPILRRSPEISMLWAGETIVFEILPGGGPTSAPRTRFDARCTPLFRTHDLAASVQRLVAARVSFLEHVSVPGGDVAYFLDPDGNLVGLHQRSRESTRAEDVEAFRRWDARETIIPGVEPLPAELQHLGWVVLRSADPAGLAAFYRDVLGLAIGHEMGARGVTFEIGDTTMLELLPGGTAKPPPADRAQVTDSLIIRIHDLDSTIADLESHGVVFLDDPFPIPGGRLAFFADPEGNLIGLQERTPSDARPEDAEAWRRWRLKRET